MRVMRALAPENQSGIIAALVETMRRALAKYARFARRWAEAAYVYLRADPERVFVLIVGTFVLTLFVIEEVLIAHDIPPRIVAVDSVPLEESYSLAEWTLEKAESGYIEGATVSGARLDTKIAKTLADTDEISLYGWAGDTDLGMRFANVAFSMCDRIIGSAKVDFPRQDVARQVHTNLGTSGWAAKLLVSHLPRCNDARLAGWAVAPFGRTLYPLHGGLSLALAPGNGSTNDPEVVATTTKLVHPADVEDRGRRIVVAIKTGTVNLRRCGAASCAVVGTLGRGLHSGIRLGDNDAWTLVMIPDVTSGWISRQAASVVPKN